VERIPPSERPLVDDAISVYCRIFGRELSSVRLLGSVARGDAVPNESDIDFVALLGRPPTAQEIDALRHAAMHLDRKYASVARVDLDAFAEGRLEGVRRFILGSDSVRLFGTDEIPDGEQVIERNDLVVLVTPPANELIRSYRTGAEGAGDPATVRLLSRVTGKDLLKSLRGVALQRGADYEVAIDAIYQQVLSYVPEHRDLAERLHQSYREPFSDRQELLALISLAAQALGDDNSTD